MAGNEPGFDLERFLEAQESGSAYERALSELRHGHKSSHWIWFVFPQLAGLGRSPTARHFALSSLEEARAYLAHPVLGPRLEAACRVLVSLEEADPVAVLGPLDAMKLRSSMTLFLRAAPAQPLFAEVLQPSSPAARTTSPTACSVGAGPSRPSGRSTALRPLANGPSRRRAPPPSGRRRRGRPACGS